MSFKLFIPFFIISLVVNLFIWMGINRLVNPTNEIKRQSSIPIKIRKEDIPLRKFGEKKSDGKNFGKSKKGSKHLKNLEKKVDLNDLAINQRNTPQKNVQNHQLKNVLNNGSRTRNSEVFVFNSSQASPQAKTVLANSQLGHKLEAPKGIPFDQLNSLEKIYYIFNKRVFDVFANTTISILNQEIEANPNLKDKLNNNSYDMSGLVSYDRKGNLTSVKITSAVKDEQISQLFEKVLVNIKNIPNPPKAFIKDQDQFRIHYRLKFN